MAMSMADALDDDAAPDTTAAFTLHLDKPLLSQVENAAWNPEKDLLATVTRDHQIIVHRTSWQRLWAISPETKVTSLCWRPDGKALAVGHVDGSIAIHDVENGDVLQQQTPHDASVECLYWAQERQKSVNIKDLAIRGMHVAEPAYRFLDASALQVSLSKDLHNMIVICSGVQSVESLQVMAGAESRASGLYAISVDTSLLGDRRKELREVALQASSVELLEVVEATVIVMRKY